MTALPSLRDAISPEALVLEPAVGRRSDRRPSSFRHCVFYGGGMVQHSDIRVRLAGTRDRRAFSEIDPKVGSDLARRDIVDSAIAARMCWIAEQSGKPAGYGILSRKFFSRDFIELLYVAEEERRKGIGAAVLHAIESAVTADRVFTSTNESNEAMRALLEQCSYKPSGKIDNLDPGDPELVFVKFLPKNVKPGAK